MDNVITLVRNHMVHLVVSSTNDKEIIELATVCADQYAKDTHIADYVNPEHTDIDATARMELFRRAKFVLEDAPKEHKKIPLFWRLFKYRYYQDSLRASVDFFELAEELWSEYKNKNT